MRCWSNGLLDQWAVELMGCRTNGLSDQRAVGTLRCPPFYDTGVRHPSVIRSLSISRPGLSESAACIPKCLAEALQIWGTVHVGLHRVVRVGRVGVSLVPVFLEHKDQGPVSEKNLLSPLVFLIPPFHWPTILWRSWRLWRFSQKAWSTVEAPWNVRFCRSRQYTTLFARWYYDRGDFAALILRPLCVSIAFVSRFLYDQADQHALKVRPRRACCVRCTTGASYLR